MKNPITLSREQVEVLLKRQNHFFPRIIRKGETVTQTCGHPACRYEITWVQQKKGEVGWHEDLITHIFKEEHYVISAY